MKKLFFLGFIIGVWFSPVSSYAQEEQEIEVEQSAEVFLEDYSDTFQENFFEGLKQKGIQNYDRAVTYFLECKRLQPENSVISFELAKSYLADSEYIMAEEYAVEAVNNDPENYWYAEILTNVVEAKKTVLEELKDVIPWDNTIFRGNLADIYFLNEDYLTAQSILKGIKTPKKYERLERKIIDSIAEQERNVLSKKALETVVSNNDLTDVNSYKSKIEGLLTSAADNEMLLQITEDAIENFPSQPYFYYANGTALNVLLKYKEAIDILETALDYLTDDIPLENAIYKELANAFTAINNTSKANMYLSKIKSGF
jgi:tetratricopeptide (TPR) repeat protein